MEQFPIERRKQFEISSRHPLNQSDAKLTQIAPWSPGFSRLFSLRFLIGSFWYVPLHSLVVVITLVLVKRYSVEMHFTIFKHWYGKKIGEVKTFYLNHANIICSIANSKSNGVLYVLLDESHNLSFLKRRHSVCKKKYILVKTVFD